MHTATCDRVVLVYLDYIGTSVTFELVILKLSGWVGLGGVVNKAIIVSNRTEVEWIN